MKKLLPESFREKWRPQWHAARDGSRSFVSAVWLPFRIAVHPVLRKPLPDQKEVGKNLHLGCGDVDHPGFINIDARPAPHVHYIQGVDRLRRFEDNSCDLIYVSHCLEHFSFHQTEKILREWRRCLKPRGILRISVPDFDKLLSIYEAAGRDPRRIQSYLLGAQTYPQNYHYAVFSLGSLSQQLLDAGFTTVKEWVRDTGPFTDVADISSYHSNVNGTFYPVSLNIEAVK